MDTTVTTVEAAALDRDRIYRQTPLLSSDELEAAARRQGFQFATYGDMVRAQWSICLHGIATDRNADHHACVWTPLVRKRGSQ